MGFIIIILSSLPLFTIKCEHKLSPEGNWIIFSSIKIEEIEIRQHLLTRINQRLLNLDFLVGLQGQVRYYSTPSCKWNIGWCLSYLISCDSMCDSLKQFSHHRLRNRYIDRIGYTLLCTIHCLWGHILSILTVFLSPSVGSLVRCLAEQQAIIRFSGVCLYFFDFEQKIPCALNGTWRWL